MADKKNNELTQKMLFLIDDKGKMIVNPNIQNNSKDETDKDDYFEMPIFWDNDSKKNVYTGKNQNVADTDDSQNLLRERYERIRETLKRNSKLNIPVHPKYENKDDKDDSIIYDYIKTIYEKAMRNDSESEKYKEILNIILNGTPETADKDYIGIDLNDLPAFLRHDKYKSQFEKQKEKPDIVIKDNDKTYYTELKNQLIEEIKEDIKLEVKRTVQEQTNKQVEEYISNLLISKLKEKANEDNKFLYKVNYNFDKVSDLYKSSEISDNLDEKPSRKIRLNLFDGVTTSQPASGNDSKADRVLKYLDEYEELDEDFDTYVLIPHVKEYLEQDRRSQKWLSEKTSIPQSSLSLILKGTAPCSLAYAIRISRVMKRPIEQLFTYTNIITVTE